MGLQQAPLLIASLLLCIGSACGVSAQYRCPPSSCGNLQIRYPFRLKGDNPTCGDRRYELTCDGNRTIIDINSGKYFVKSISYSKGDEHIRITDVGLASGGCALPSNTLSRDTISHDERFTFSVLYRIGDIIQSEASFVNCTREIQGSYVPVPIPSQTMQTDQGYLLTFPARKGSYVSVPCLNRSNASVYVIFTSRVAGLPPSCRFLAMVPIDEVVDTEARVFEELQSGATLNWVRPSCWPASLVIKDCYTETR